MKNNPLVVSLLAGIVVVLIIVGVSLIVKIKAINGEHRVELAQKFSVEKDLDAIKAANSVLGKENEDLKAQVETLTIELERTKELNRKLEDNLKDAMIKQRLKER